MSPHSEKTAISWIAVVASIWLVGCTPSDPVKGWKGHNANLNPPNLTNYHNYPNSWYYSPDQIYHINQTILDDYPKFIEQLKHEYPVVYVSEIDFYEDGTGRHAVKITAEVGPREYKEFYLMYDKSDNRTKVIKGKSWRQFHI